MANGWWMNESDPSNGLMSSNSFVTVMHVNVIMWQYMKGTHF